MRAQDECRQSTIAAAVQGAVSAPPALPLAGPEGRGNAGAMERVENQNQFSHPSHSPLKIPQRRRDFHIPTAPACAGWKSGKPTSGFPLFHRAHATTTTALSLYTKTKERKSAAVRPPHSLLPLSLPSSSTDFMLIFRLENAGLRAHH
jgi:hypothetical protein